MKRSGTTNENLKGLVLNLKKNSHSREAKIWKRVASDLEKPSRQRRVVNLSRLNRFTKENETVVVPGKVLGAGSISHSIVIAALAFSGNARQQIEKANGKCITIPELLKQNPKGKDVRIIG
jgi:large subunit ribosomal protein L18e